MLVVASASDYGYGSNPLPLHKPMFDVEEKPSPIGIQGLILCRSGLETKGIKGNLEASKSFRDWTFTIPIQIDQIIVKSLNLFYFLFKYNDLIIFFIY